MYGAAAYAGGFLLNSQYDAFGPQPENITKDVQERADRVGNAVYNTISGRVDADTVDQAIHNEIFRSATISISYPEDGFEILYKYRKFLHEAKDVVSATGGNLTNQTTINKIDKELAQMNEAKKNLY
ncbi:MAG: hypothetical protein WAQ47_08355 [Methanosarcina flavescens]|jgi:hypothetical protein